MREINRYIYYTPTAVVVLFILYATWSAHPVMASELPHIPYIDKLIHAAMMGTLLTTFSFDWQRANPDKRITPSLVWAVFGCVIAFSFADELIQGALDNGRDADPFDLLADFVGALVAAYIAPPVVRKMLHVTRQLKA